MNAARDKSPSKPNGANVDAMPASNTDSATAALQSDANLDANLDANSASATAELTTAVDDLLNDLRTKFQTVSDEMLAKMDDMSRRLDNLESQLRRKDSRPEADAGSAGVSSPR